MAPRVSSREFTYTGKDDAHHEKTDLKVFVGAPANPSFGMTQTIKCLHRLYFASPPVLRWL